jgi:hypothetical protein
MDCVAEPAAAVAASGPRAHHEGTTMNRMLRASSLLVGLVVLAAAAFLAPPTGATQGGALEQKHAALAKEYEEAVNKWNAEYRAADKAARKALQSKRPAPEYLGRFQALAEEAKGTDVAAKALMSVMEVGLAAKRLPESKAALAELKANHLASPAIEKLPFAAMQVVEGAEFDALLAALLEKSPHKPVKAAAAFAQWQSAQNALQMQGKDPAEDAAVLALAKAIAKDYADVKFPFDEKQTYGDIAGGFVFVAENLSVGKTAPDQEAIDENGVKFKVSDYRGKVVVLDFWGYW